MPAPRSSAAGSASSARSRAGSRACSPSSPSSTCPTSSRRPWASRWWSGVYLSHVMAAPYPPLLGVMTYVLVTLSHVEFPEDYVDVALWRIAAIGMGVVLGTGAQLFLWPDDPIDKLRAGARAPPAPGARARRSGDRAPGDAPGPAIGGDADARRPDDRAAASRQCRSASRVSPSPARRAHRAHPRGRTALHLGPLGGRDDAGHDGAGGTRRCRPRAAPGDQRGERAVGPRAREPARAARLDRPDGHHPRRGGSGPRRLCPGARPRRDGALARPDRIPDRRSPTGWRFPLGWPAHDGADAGDAPVDRRLGARHGRPRRVARHRGAEDRAQGRARPRAVLPGDARARLAGHRDLRGHMRHHRCRPRWARPSARPCSGRWAPCSAACSA